MSDDLLSPNGPGSSSHYEVESTHSHSSREERSSRGHYSHGGHQHGSNSQSSSSRRRRDSSAGSQPGRAGSSSGQHGGSTSQQSHQSSSHHHSSSSKPSVIMSSTNATNRMDSSTTSTTGVGGTDEVRLGRCHAEAQRRENILVMRLATKEQEVHDFFGQLEELRTSLGGGLRNALLDPVVNSMFQKMRDELRDTKQRLEQSQQELNAWKFTPDSNTGKRLMARCRTLIQENEELGREMEQGRLARLEGQLSANTQQIEQLQGGQKEVDDLLLDLDQDMEGLQTTVMFLQKQLGESRSENRRLRTLLAQTDITAEHDKPPVSAETRTSQQNRRSKSRSATPQQQSTEPRTSSNPILDAFRPSRTPTPTKVAAEQQQQQRLGAGLDSVNVNGEHSPHHHIDDDHRSPANPPSPKRTRVEELQSEEPMDSSESDGVLLRMPSSDDGEQQPVDGEQGIDVDTEQLSTTMEESIDTTDDEPQPQQQQQQQTTSVRGRKPSKRGRGTAMASTARTRKATRQYRTKMNGLVVNGDKRD